MSGRGKGTCSKCGAEYANRYKPKFCQCGYFLGGNYEPPAKKAKSLGIVEVVEVLPLVYSTTSSSRNDRCIVMKTDNRHWVCLHKECLKTRATFVSAGTPEGFECGHVTRVQSGSVSKPLDAWSPASADIDNFTECSPSVRVEIKRIVSSLRPNQPAVICVCENKYLVFGPPSATNTIGYCHVTKAESKLFCASKDCTSSVAKCKHERQKEMCLHLHLLLLYNKISRKVFSVDKTESSTASSDAMPEEENGEIVITCKGNNQYFHIVLRPVLLFNTYKHKRNYYITATYLRNLIPERLHVIPVPYRNNRDRDSRGFSFKMLLPYIYNSLR